jgi:hypothetical protein
MKRATLWDVGEMLDRSLEMERASEGADIDMFKNEEPKHATKDLTSWDLRWSDKVLWGIKPVEPSIYE